MRGGALPPQVVPAGGRNSRAVAQEAETLGLTTVDKDDVGRLVVLVTSA